MGWVREAGNIFLVARGGRNNDDRTTTCPDGLIAAVQTVLRGLRRYADRAYGRKKVRTRDDDQRNDGLNRDDWK